MKIWLVRRVFDRFDEIDDASGCKNFIDPHNFCEETLTIQTRMGVRFQDNIISKGKRCKMLAKYVY
jgi:hypothetical protein